MIHILGASGFIGKKLHEYFLLNNYPVKGYSSQDCDLLSKDSVNHTLSEIDYEDVIIMASAITRLKDNSLEAMIKNIKMADNMKSFIEKNKISQFIFFSTSEVYGVNPNLPINEKNSISPENYYAISKISSEFIINSGCLKNDIPLLTLRFPGIYGEGDYGKGVINKMVESAKTGKIILFNDGKDKRDFVYIKDFCRVIKEGIDKRVNSTINIATGKSYSMEEVVEMIKINFDYPVLIEFQKDKNEQRKAKEMEFDISLLKKIFPDIHFTNLEEGIKHYIEYNLK